MAINMARPKPRLKQYSKHKPCYFCGAPPLSTAEHVPPRLMFNGLECDSITVPSCPKHNNSKGNRDAAIVTALLRATDSVMGHTSEPIVLSPNVDRVMKELRPHYEQAKSVLDMLPILDDPPASYSGVDTPYIRPTVDLREWMLMLTAGLIWSVTGEYDPATDWSDAWYWSPNEFSSEGSMTRAQHVPQMIHSVRMQHTLDQMATWHRGWSSHPKRYPREVYRFDVAFLDEQACWDGRNMGFRHWFFDAYLWYVFFRTSLARIQIVKDAVDVRS